MCWPTTLGRPVRLIVTAGQVGDCTQAEALLEGQSASTVLADKAYDSNAVRETIADMKAEAVIPSNRSRKMIIPHDTEAYRHRNSIEHCFNRLKHCRRFAARYDRRRRHFEGFAHLAAITIWIR
ncbi:IS5 family transposase [Martelella lutilitoris]|uniref:IS5 family transposase n=1 Tax=Martelella lutilitoris TaxID=2583532 RepID=A0A5C4JR45_9HYPH|nr:IS5 family transposase [Martelella lutilitoris]TNB47760.1 IS5 family transposase [Martelella lutilitoris]